MDLGIWFYALTPITEKLLFSLEIPSRFCNNNCFFSVFSREKDIDREPVILKKQESRYTFHQEQYVPILHKLGFCSALLSFNLNCKEILYCSITFRLNNSEIPNSSVIFED